MPQRGSWWHRPLAHTADITASGSRRIRAGALQGGAEGPQDVAQPPYGCARSGRALALLLHACVPLSWKGPAFVLFQAERQFISVCGECQVLFGFKRLRDGEEGRSTPAPSSNRFEQRPKSLPTGSPARCSLVPLLEVGAVCRV